MAARTTPTVAAFDIRELGSIALVALSLRILDSPAAEGVPMDTMFSAPEDCHKSPGPNLGTYQQRRGHCNTPGSGAAAPAVACQVSAAIITGNAAEQAGWHSSPGLQASPHSRFSHLSCRWLGALVDDGGGDSRGRPPPGGGYDGVDGAGVGFLRPDQKEQRGEL